MPPILAALLTLGFIVFLYRRDMRANPKVTGALWIPLSWLFLTSSRGFTDWLALGGLQLGGRSLEEGSPVDRTVFCILIGAGLYVLRKRNVRLGELVRNNRWLAAFLIYCLLSVLWSDYPFVSLKRWIKVIGNPVMALMILTEPDPEEAFINVMKRCAFIILPVSILFIKYYPQWGRGFSSWTGAAFNTGITSNKNGLGVDCLIYGFFFVWYTLRVRLWPKIRRRRDELILCGGFLFMTWYLFQQADSKTPFTACCLGIATLLFVSSSLVNKRMLGTYILVGLFALVFLEALFNIYEVILGVLGRDATLTDRTLLWADLLKEDINPLFGAGFESFWLGERLQRIWAKWTFGPNQAHNGYLETYLNLGLIGLFLLLGLLVIVYAKARKSLLNRVEFARYRLGFLAAIIFYDWTEAAFKTTHIVFLMLYLIAIDYRRRAPQKAAPRVHIPATRVGGLEFAQPPV